MMKILHVAPTFFPAVYWGGPIFSVYALCNAIAATSGVELQVLATDSAGPMRGERVPRDIDRGLYPGYHVTFARRLWGRDVAPEFLTDLPSLVSWADVVHLTGVYSFPTIPTLVATRLWRKPVVWSPRGALQRWPGSSRPILKGLWEGCCNLCADKPRLVLHATSTDERDESLARIRAARVEVIPNGVEMPAQLERSEWMPGGRIRLLYLGRLHAKKGIENLLRAISIFGNRGVSLRICGTGEDDYVRSLRELVRQLGLEPQVTFVGFADGSAKSTELRSADFTVVPSFTENFAMVVAESLAHGTPVVASKGTPWADLERNRAGLWVENDPNSLASAIEMMSRSDLAAMGSRGRDWMQRDFGWTSVAARMVHLYSDLVDGQRAS